MLCCSSECGSISIVQLRTIYCNTHVHTFYVCLCLLALTFVCNSTYLMKCSFQIYQKSIVVLIRSSKVWFKTTSCAKGPVTRCNFPGNLQRNSTLKQGRSSRYSDRCISRKCDVTMGTVGATERRRREHPRGSGGMLIQKNFEAVSLGNAISCGLRAIFDTKQCLKMKVF